MSLPDAMKLIQDGLNHIGPISFTAYATDNRSGKTAMKRISHEYSQVIADPGACRISYHWKGASDGRVFQDSDHTIGLKEVAEVDVVTGEQAFQADLAQAGQTELKARVDPAVFVLEVRRPNLAREGRPAIDSFFFGDQDAANHAARAMTRAMELCGGGSKAAF